MSDKTWDLAKAYEKARLDESRAHRELFSAANCEVFRGRVERIARQLVRGTDEPRTCTDEMSIPWFIAKNGFKPGHEDGTCPAGDVEWKASGLNIRVGVASVFKGEVDSEHHFVFPADCGEFEEYLAGLEKAGDEREAARRAEAGRVARAKDDEERRVFEGLKAKFEGKVLPV